MPKDFNYSDNAYIFRVIDSHWRCVNRPDEKRGLANFLLDHGFDIPECITYCLAENDRFALKFRAFGGQVSVYINSLKPFKNGQNS